MSLSARFEEVRDDVAGALRQMRRAPAFTALAATTLALGIGANSAIFALVDATLLRPLSVHQPDRYHRRGFDVRYRYPGEGVAPLAALVDALSATVGDRPYDLLIEGLDSTADTLDQHERLATCMPLMRDLLDRAAVG